MFEFSSNLQKTLTPEQLLLQESYSKFVDKEVTPYANKWYYEDGQTDKVMYQKMGQNGFLCTWADKKYGGAEKGFIEAWIILNELQRRGYSSMEPYLHSDIVGPYFKKFASEEMQDRFMPDLVKGDKILAVAMTEPDFGSDVGAAQTTAVKDGDDYIINGDKVFISNGLIADLFVVLARTDPDPALKHKGLSLIVVDTTESEGVGRKKMDKIGMHYLDLAEISFTNVRVPQKNLMGVEGKGFSYIMKGLQQERLIAANGYLNACERALSEAIKYAKKRIVFGKPLSTYQDTEFKLAELAPKILAGRRMLEDLILAHTRGEEVNFEVACSKMYLAELAQETVRICLQIHGGYGYMRDLPIGQMYMDIRSSSLAAGTTEVMKMIVSRELFSDK